MSNKLTLGFKLATNYYNFLVDIGFSKDIDKDTYKY